MALGNVMVATPKFVDVHRAPLPLWKAYIIDFDRSRQLGQGPGIQRPIQLPLTQYDPPNGMTSMDPYSWDVYCTGHLFVEVFNVSLYLLPFMSRLADTKRFTGCIW